MRTPTSSQWAKCIIASLRHDIGGLSMNGRLWAVCLNTGFLDGTGRPSVSCLKQVELALGRLKLNTSHAEIWLTKLRDAGFVKGAGIEERFTVYDHMLWPQVVLRQLVRFPTSTFTRFVKTDESAVRVLTVVLDANRILELLAALFSLKDITADSLQRLASVTGLMAESMTHK